MNGRGEAYDLMNCVQVDFWDAGTACEMMVRDEGEIERF